MSKIRIGTFNVENLFARFKFKGKRVKKPDGSYENRSYTTKELQEIFKEGWAVDKTKFVPFSEEERGITAAAIKVLEADILGLQEVENMDTLKKFVTQFLSAKDYTYKIVIDANDPRLIDIALLSRFPIAYINTYQFERSPNKKSLIFSRDCLEVGIQISQNTILPVFVNHFKSMIGGRQKTMARRRLQAETVVRILQQKFGDNAGESAWIVLGDLNDYLPSNGLEPLLSQPWIENVIKRIPDPKWRWTHYYKDKDEYRQLDYILVSKSLAVANPDAIPEIERRGLPKRATLYDGPWFPGVGNNKPKASDHCPVFIDLNI